MRERHPLRRRELALVAFIAALIAFSACWIVGVSASREEFELSSDRRPQAGGESSDAPSRSLKKSAALAEGIPVDLSAPPEATAPTSDPVLPRFQLRALDPQGHPLRGIAVHWHRYPLSFTDGELYSTGREEIEAPFWGPDAPDSGICLTNDQGIASLPATDDCLSLFFRGEDWEAQAGLALRPGPIPGETITVEVETYAFLELRVLDQAGVAASGVPIGLTSELSRARRQEWAAVRRTDAEGRVRFPVFDLGERVVMGPAFPCLDPQFQIFEAPQAGTISEALILPPFGWLKVHRHPTDRALGLPDDLRFSVRVSPKEITTTRFPYIETASFGDGGSRLDLGPVGTELPFEVCDADGEVIAAFLGPEEQGQSMVHQLASRCGPTRITGEIRGADGSSLAGERLTVSIAEDWDDEYGCLHFRVDAASRFDLLLTPELQELVAEESRQTDHVRWRIFQSDRQDMPFRSASRSASVVIELNFEVMDLGLIELRPHPRLAGGRVTDEQGQPLAHALVWWHSPQDHPLDSMRNEFAMRTSEDGRFELHRRRTNTESEHRLSVWRPGYALFTTDSEPDPESDLVIALRRSSELRVEVVADPNLALHFEVRARPQSDEGPTSWFHEGHQDWREGLIMGLPHGPLEIEVLGRAAWADDIPFVVHRETLDFKDECQLSLDVRGLIPHLPLVVRNAEGEKVRATLRMDSCPTPWQGFESREDAAVLVPKRFLKQAGSLTYWRHRALIFSDRIPTGRIELTPAAERSLVVRTKGAGRLIPKGLTLRLRPASPENPRVQLIVGVNRDGTASFYPDEAGTWYAEVLGPPPLGKVRPTPFEVGSLNDRKPIELSLDFPD